VTVSTSDSIRIRPWRGYDDPGLPVGMYVAQGATLGDASGGDRIIFFDFKGEGNPVSGRLFNIEQINVIATGATAQVGHMVANNWESVSAVGLINRQWRFNLVNNNNGFAAMDEREYLPMPLFLGAVAPIPSLAADIEIGTDNEDGDTLLATIQGYIWEARSIQAPGGLRRPTDSLYGGGGR